MTDAPLDADAALPPPPALPEEDPSAGLIRSSRFRAQREAEWQRLEGIVGRAERRGIKSLPYDDVRDLPTLYRGAVNALSVAREISLDRRLREYLEALSARAYLLVYAPQETASGALGRFLARSGPAAMRRSGLALLLGFVALFGGALIGYLLFMQDETWYDALMPGSMQQGRGLSSSVEELLEVIYGEDEDALGSLAAFAAFLFSNNTRIAIFAFSLGVLACLPTFALVFYNGIILGAFFALHVDRGIGLDLFGWLSIHGVTELAAIIVAAAGGFRLGLAVLFPGQLTRRAALRRVAPDATKLAVMAAIMLVAAAVLEGFGRQLVTSLEARLIIGWGVGALWLTYFLYAGRGSEPDHRGAAR